MITSYLNSPILITGAQRSGSSIIARIINHCGAWKGNTSEMFENNKIKKIVDDFYYPRQYDVKGQYPLPNVKNLPIIPKNWRNDIENQICSERFIDEKVWAYKSHRICQIWPIWNAAYPNAKWIIVRRRTGDIISSCIKTGYMTAFADKEIQQKVGVKNERDGWKWWVYEHERRFIEMIEAGVNCKQIWPERMAMGDFTQIEEMLKWLDLPWKNDIPKIVSPLFDNSLQRERKK
jgi:hypothetical protein